MNPTSSSRSNSPTPSAHSAVSFGRSSGKRTATSIDILSPHPLLASPPGPELAFHANGGSTVGPYAVYTAKKKLNESYGPETTPTTASSSTSSTLLSPGIAASTSQPSKNPTSPKAATYLPPLISRPSNANLPVMPATKHPVRSVSEATVKLLGQRIKADVQSLGLANDSAGGLMVQKLGSMPRDAEWGPIMNAISSGKVTLLLPAERPSSASILTPAFFLNHLVLMEPTPPSTSTLPAPSQRSFSTLSGIRGVLKADVLVFSSPGNALVESGRGLLKPGTLSSTTPNYANEEVQRSLMGSASPLPATTSTPFPSSVLVSTISDLSIPRTTVAPGRGKDFISRPSSSTGSRLAALFAKAPIADTSDGTLAPLTSAPTDPAPEAASAPSNPSSMSQPTASKQPIPNLDISVLAIGKYIRHAEIIRAIGKCVEIQLRESLKGVDGCEGDASVSDRICSFASRFQPPSSWTSSFPHTGKALSGDSYYDADVDDISDAYQDMLHAIRLDLIRNIRANSSREKRREGKGLGDSVNSTPEKGEGVLPEEEDMGLLEERVDASLEIIEETLTTVLYDRLFSPASSGDAQADENLSSRIAALNILELSLEHLGLDLGAASHGWDESSRTIRDSVEDIIGLASLELARLQESVVRSPRSKLSIFVNLHKIIVEGLSSLPPIPLKESTDTTIAGGTKPSEEVEMDDASLRGPSRASSRPSSLHPVDEDLDEDNLRTPRPGFERTPSSIPEMRLPSATSAPLAGQMSGSSSTSSLNGEVISSVHDATMSSVFDSTPRRDSTSSSADLILPLLIYLIVQYNPVQLPSTLVYAQRFRTESLMRGEASYCATNVQAAIEFLTHVEISTLGLSSQKVLGIGAAAAGDGLGKGSKELLSRKLKGRVNNVSHELDHFVDTANSTIVNVVDSSYRILFGPKGFAPKTIEDVRNVLDGAGSVASKARGTLLRRASSPAQFHPPNTDAQDIPPMPTLPEGVQREMVNFTPSSDPDESEEAIAVPSINKEKTGITSDDRPSIGERLASISGLGRSGGGDVTPPRASLFASATPRRATINTSSLGVAAAATSSFPFLFGTSTRATVAPVQRFLDCEASDLRLGEVAELLAEYKKLARNLEESSKAPVPF